mgnify:CR=1 FL=1
MSILEAIIFGLVQGLTEFVPISSSAHLVILGYAFEINTPGLTFEVFLHFASLLAVLIYFQRDLRQLLWGTWRSFKSEATDEDRVARKWVIFLGVATLISGVLGLSLESVVGSAIKSPSVVGCALLVTAVLLVLVERARALGDRGPANLRWLDALVVGLAQAVAIIPGISRAGSTLIAGLALGMNRATAVRFSFLLAIPTLVGTSMLAMRDISAGDLSEIGTTALIVSFVVSFFASLASIVWLIRMLKNQRLYWFSVYLVALAVYVFIAFPNHAAF